MTSPENWTILRKAHSDYHESGHHAYDESIREVADRVEQNGSLSKADIGAVVFWKRLRGDTRWARELQYTPDSAVKEATAAAVRAVRDPDITVPGAASRGRSALSSLPGFGIGDALASAVLFTAAPKRMAVYDKRTHTALSSLGFTLSNAPARYRRYMEILETLLAQQPDSGKPWIARDLDLALFQLGGRPQES